MLSVSAQGRVFFATQPVDMRKGFNGLVGVVRSVLDEDPLSGDVFCFLNRRRNLMKVLCFNGDGYVIFYKRLEKGLFQSPVTDGIKGTILPAQLAMLLAGIDIHTAKRRARYQRPPPRTSV